MARITLGEILDLIDANRESEEKVCVVNANGQNEMCGMVCSDLWMPHEKRIVNSIEADADNLLVWLEDQEKEGDSNS